MKTSPVLDLLEDAKKDFPTLKAAFEHVAGVTKQSMSSVKSTYHRSRRGSGACNANRKLLPEQETTLVAVAQAFSVNNVAMSSAQLRDLVARKFGVAVSKMWVTRFTRRHRQQLSKRACKALADKRVGPRVYGGVVDFCDELATFLEHKHFPAHAVFNFDETRVVQKRGNMKLSRMEAAGKERANVRTTRHNTVATLLPFVSADGGVLLSVYILKGRFGDGSSAPVNFTMERARGTTRGTWPRFYCWTDTGYLDADTFKAVLGKVAELWQERHPGIPALLFSDQLAAHRRADIVEHAIGLGLYLFSLPKNTSHITQPLDEAPFGTLQAVTRHNHEAAVMDGMLTNSGTRDALLMAAYAAERRAFTRPAIRGAFRRCRLWPFQPVVMRASVRANLGLAATGETPVEAARSAAAAVIQAAQERVDATAARTVAGRAVVRRAEVHSPLLLLDQHRQLEAAAAKEQQEKADRSAQRASKKADKERERAGKVVARQQRRCRVCAEKEYRGGKAWTGCPCTSFWVCRGCTKSIHAGVVMAQHIQECPGPPSEDDSSSCDEGGPSSGDESAE